MAHDSVLSICLFVQNFYNSEFADILFVSPRKKRQLQLLTGQVNGSVTLTQQETNHKCVIIESQCFTLKTDGHNVNPRNRWFNKLNIDHWKDKYSMLTSKHRVSLAAGWRFPWHVIHKLFLSDPWFDW